MNFIHLSKRFYCNKIINKNVLEILKDTKDKLLKSKNELISNYSELESKLLVSHVLKINDHNDQYQLFNKKVQSRIISNEEYNQLQSFIERRLNNEPINYIIGYRYFWKNKFFCNHSTLIPRPDSETIIEKIIEESKEKEIKIKKILDLGTGTGCLLLSTLNEFKDSIGVGIDKSNEALIIANKNAIELSLDKRVSLLNFDWNNYDKNQISKLLSSSPSPSSSNINNEKFDLVISNPPYISNEEFKYLNPIVTEWEPKTALIADENGLKDYKSIASFLNENKDSLLSDNCLIVFEIGKGQEKDIQSIMENKYSFKYIGYKKDLNSIIRCLVFMKK
ncbi:hypothetical protein ACTFIW_006223 [Dictyostelium discoideum]